MQNMLSKNKQKYLLSLQRKKIRQKEGVFIAEGRKTIEAIISSKLEVVEIFCLDLNADYLKKYEGSKVVIDSDELKSITSYTNPDDGIAIVRIPRNNYNPENLLQGVSIFLDQVNDPGNMGTIIRLADWFGIDYILYNKGTVDPYLSKCVQSSMGAIANVCCIEVENSVLEELNSIHKLPVIGTKMDGENIYSQDLPNKAIIIMGNEANGISDEVLKMSSEFISIPKGENSISESLNVAMSCGIILSHFKK